MRLHVPVAGMTLGVYPGRGVVTAEARVASMLAGHAGDATLCAPALLPAAVASAVRALRSIGVHVAGPVVVLRVDLAAELCFAEPSDGLAFLLACQRALHLSRLAQRSYSAAGEKRVETIAWQTPKGNRTQLRLYDSGAKRGTHAPGGLLRLERQRRWDGVKAPTPDQLLASDLAAIFRAPLRAWLKEAPEIIVATPPDAVKRVFDRVRRRELGRRQADALSAKINMLGYGADLLSPLDRRRRELDLRKAGITLDCSGDLLSLLIDLRGPLAALAAQWVPAMTCATPGRTCSNCGRSLDGYRRQALYCGGPCRAAASRARAMHGAAPKDADGAAPKDADGAVARFPQTAQNRTCEPLEVNRYRPATAAEEELAAYYLREYADLMVGRNEYPC